LAGWHCQVFAGQFEGVTDSMTADHSILVTDYLDSQIPQFKLVIHVCHARCPL